MPPSQRTGAADADAVPDGTPNRDEQVADQAQFLLQHAPAMALCGTWAPIYADKLQPTTYLAAVQQELVASGAPRDPVERMLLEELLMGHGAIAKLFVDAGATSQVDERCELLSAAARLTAECRRLALALKEYRAGAASRLRVLDNEEDGTDDPRRRARQKA